MKEMRRGKSNISDRLVKIFTYTFCIAFAIMCIYPFYYVIIYSISDPDLVVKGVYLMPQGFDVTVYKKLFEQNDMVGAAFISLLRTVLGTSITVICTSFLAFLMTRQEMFGRKFVYRLVIVTMYVGAGLVPVYITYKYYHLLDNFLVYIIPGAISAYYMILIKTFMEQLPESLEESATLEGAGVKDLFFKIILPLSKPIIATVVVYCAVGQWNAWTDNFFYIRNTNLQTLQLILYNYLNSASAIVKAMEMAGSAAGDITSKMETQITPEGVKMASIVVTVFPILFVYPFAQKYFTKGIMMGAVKG